MNINIIEESVIAWLENGELPDEDTLNRPPRQILNEVNGVISKISSIIGAGSGITSPVSFTKLTNTINSTEIGTLELEIGDIIQITNAAIPANNGIFTVSSSGSNAVILNEFHANGIGVKSLSDDLSNNNLTVNIKLLSKWYSAAGGLGQAWQTFGLGEADNQREPDHEYTNSTNRTRKVSIDCSTKSSSKINITIDGVIVSEVFSTTTADSTLQVYFEVPPNSKYTIALTGTASILRWAELC